MMIKPAVKSRYQKAFTLLEVLIALAVLTLGLGTVMKVTASQTSQLAYLKNKTIALWLANNKANEVKLDKWPGTGTTTGYETMANQEWDWKVKVSDTEDVDLRRLDIEVNLADKEGEPLIRFISFVGKKADVTRLR